MKCERTPADESSALLSHMAGLILNQVDIYVQVHPWPRLPPGRPLLVVLGLYLRLAMNKVFG